jgi:predicted peroxiredoxin
MRGAPGSEMVGCRTEAKEQPMKITYFVSAGTADPTRVSIPLHLAANGSVEVGQEASIVLGGDATELLLGDAAARVEGVGVPPLRDLLAKLREHEVPVFV